MERKTNRMARVAALTVGLGIAAVSLNAQQGSFDLPVRAHWGAAVLEPGEHSLKIPISNGQAIVYLGSRAGTEMAVPLTTERVTESSRSYLHLAKVNGEYYVDAFQSGLTGRRFIFPKAKSTRRSSPAGEAEAMLVRVKGE